MIRYFTLLLVSAYLYFFSALLAFLPLVRKKQTNNCFENKNKILQLMKSGYIGQEDFDRKTLLTLLFSTRRIGELLLSKL